MTERVRENLSNMRICAGKISVLETLSTSDIKNKS